MRGLIAFIDIANDAGHSLVIMKTTQAKYPGGGKIRFIRYIGKSVFIRAGLMVNEAVQRRKVSMFEMIQLLRPIVNISGKVLSPRREGIVSERRLATVVGAKSTYFSLSICPQSLEISSPLGRVIEIFNGQASTRGST